MLLAGISIVNIVTTAIQYRESNIHFPRFHLECRIYTVYSHLFVIFIKFSHCLSKCSNSFIFHQSIHPKWQVLMHKKEGKKRELNRAGDDGAFVNFFNKMNNPMRLLLLLIYLVGMPSQSHSHTKMYTHNKKHCTVWSTLKSWRIKWINRRNNLIYSVCMQILLKWFCWWWLWLWLWASANVVCWYHICCFTIVASPIIQLL